MYRFEIADAKKFIADLATKFTSLDESSAVSNVIGKITFQYCPACYAAVEVPKNAETTALGAALLAGLGAGLFKDINDIAKNWQRANHYTPNINKQKRDDYYAGWSDCIGRVLK